MVTADDIQLRPVALDAPGQLTRGVGRRLVWRWVCPGPHAHPMEVVAREDEPRDLQTEAAILADPYCHYCRKALEGLMGAAWHDNDCAHVTDREPCNCGFAAAYAAAEKALAQETPDAQG